MGSGFRPAHQQRVTERDAQESILTIERGPGWLDLWSPNAAMRWRVTSAESKVVENIYTDTGPASKSRIWIGAGGAEALVDELVYGLDGTSEALQTTGRVVVGLTAEDRALAAARFYPADGRDCEDEELRGQYTPLVGQHSTWLTFTVPAGATMALGFPPEERFAGTIVSAAPFTPSIGSGRPEAPNIEWVAGAPVTNITMPVSPFEHLRVNNADIVDIRVRLLWQDFGPVRHA